MSVTEDPPVISNVVFGLADQLDRLLIAAGLPLNPPGGVPKAPPPAPKINWQGVQAALLQSWPGYPWPANFNAELVAALYSDVLGRLAQETQYQFFVGLALQSEIDQIFWLTVDNNNYWALSRQISRLQASLGSGATAGQVQQVAGNLQAEINAVAATAWANLWSLYNNQVVPLVNAARTEAWNNLWSLYSNEVVPLVNQAKAEAFNNLWSLYNNQVAPAIANEAAARTTVDNLLGQAVTQETALREQQGATLQMQVNNETSARLASEATITGVAIPTAVLQLKTQLQPQIDKVRTAVDTCLEPLCDTVTPNAKQLGGLGNLLKGLEGLGIAALLAGLVAEAIVNPEQAATAVVDVTGWIPSVADELVNAVVG